LAATVLISILNNTWFDNAFQFGVAGDTSWSFAGKEFLCDLKSDIDQPTPDLSLSSVSPSPSTILILDPVLRTLQFNVTDLVIRANLQVGPYQYDLIMVDIATGERDALMGGVITVVQGVTLTGD
jgi:hypothetical protein